MGRLVERLEKEIELKCQLHSEGVRIDEDVLKNLPDEVQGMPAALAF